MRVIVTLPEDRSTKPTVPRSNRAGRARTHKGLLIPGSPCCWVLGRLPGYLPLTSIFFGLIASALGSVSVSTPFSNVASAFSGLTGTLSVSVRATTP